jgi:hypothetical protein
VREGGGYRVRGREGLMQERGGNIGREGEERRKRVKDGLSIKFTFCMFKEDIFRDRVTLSDFVKLD